MIRKNINIDFISDDAVVCEIDSFAVAEKLQTDADEILISALNRISETRR
jgi:hypothetical protein